MTVIELCVHLHSQCIFTTDGLRSSDRIAEGIREKVGHPLKLAQVLESATWKGGREIAKRKRPETGGPPIEIESDGTVF